MSLCKEEQNKHWQSFSGTTSSHSAEPCRLSDIPQRILNWLLRHWLLRHWRPAVFTDESTFTSCQRRRPPTACSVFFSPSSSLAGIYVEEASVELNTKTIHQVLHMILKHSRHKFFVSMFKGGVGWSIYFKAFATLFKVKYYQILHYSLKYRHKSCFSQASSNAHGPTLNHWAEGC